MFGKLKKMAYFGSCCENKLKSKEKAEAAICSFGKLAFFQSTQSYSALLMKRPTIRLLFFPKALLQKCLPNTQLIYFTAAYSHSSFYSKHSNTKLAQRVLSIAKSPTELLNWVFKVRKYPTLSRLVFVKVY